MLDHHFTMFYLIFGGGKIGKGNLFSIKEVREVFVREWEGEREWASKEIEGKCLAAAGALPGCKREKKEEGLELENEERERGGVAKWNFLFISLLFILHSLQGYHDKCPLTPSPYTYTLHL